MSAATLDFLIRLFSRLVYGGLYGAALTMAALCLRAVFAKSTSGRGRMALWHSLLAGNLLALALIRGQSTWALLAADGSRFPPLRLELERLAEDLDGILRPTGAAVLRLCWNGRTLASLDGGRFLGLACGVWLAGALLVLAIYALAYGRLRRRLDRQPLCREEELLSLVRAERIWRGLSGPLSVRLVPQADFPELNCPCVVGIRRPELVLIREQWELLSDGEREAVLAHELLHVRRRDSLLLLFLVLWRAAQWYNLLLWPAQRLCRRDLELKRDGQLAREFSDGQTADYARALVALSAAGEARPRWAVPGALLCPGGVAERVRALCGRRRNRGDWPLALLGAGLAALPLALRTVPVIFQWIYRLGG